MARLIPSLVHATARLVVAIASSGNTALCLVIRRSTLERSSLYLQKLSRRKERFSYRRVRATAPAASAGSRRARRTCRTSARYRRTSCDRRLRRSWRTGEQRGGRQIEGVNQPAPHFPNVAASGRRRILRCWRQFAGGGQRAADVWGSHRRHSHAALSEGRRGPNHEGSPRPWMPGCTL
jgi:hypothetical protein